MAIFDSAGSICQLGATTVLVGETCLTGVFVNLEQEAPKIKMTRNIGSRTLFVFIVTNDCISIIPQINSVGGL